MSKPIREIKMEFTMEVKWKKGLLEFTGEIPKWAEGSGKEQIKEEIRKIAKGLGTRPELIDVKILWKINNPEIFYSVSNIRYRVKRFE